MTPRNTLGRKERLKSRKAVEALFSGGKSIGCFPLRVYYRFEKAAEPAAGPLQAGVSVSKKHFKRAVDRNRIKRLLREAYRLNRAPLAQCLSDRALKATVFLIFVDKTLPAYPVVEEAVQRALVTLQKKAETYVERPA
ncbi:MAG TPA: ribonuclease P protein component [Chitinophagaceae bacterium]|jgi:ribonuclease P protein component|nr:ribonuclease P protein component [Chitinophagaceae bacterium]